MSSERNYRFVIQVLIGALLAFFAISWLVPSYWNWSILNPNFGTPFGFLILALIGLTAFIPAFGNIIFKLINGALNYLRNFFSRVPAFPRILLLLIISAGIFYLCRGFTYLYGDGHLIISHIEKGSMISTTAYGLSLMIKYVAPILDVNGWISPADFMAWISIICGVVYLFFLYKIISLLVADKRLRLLFYLVAATSAIIILFTGYVETYSILTAWLAIYIYYSLKFLRHKGRTVVLVMLFGLGVFWHIWFAAFFPSLLYALNKRYRILSGIFLIVLSSVYVLGIIVSGSMISRSGIPPVIPVFANSRTIYSLVSYHHIADFINIMIIAGPTMILVGLVLAAMHIRRDFGPDVKLLVFAGIPAFIIALFLDPALGAVRDWDVLSIFALPIILVGIILIWQYLKRVPAHAYILIPILLLGVLHVGTFVAYNKNTDIAVDRIIRVLLEDPHYTEEYYEGERILPFSAIISNIYDDDKAGAEFLQRRAQSESGNYADMVQLAYQYHNQRDFENALKCFQKVPMQDITDTKARYCYGTTLYHLKKYRESSEVFSALAPDTNTAGLYFFLSDCLLKLSEPDSSYKVALEGFRFASDTVQYTNSISAIFYKAGYYQRTIELVNRALKQRPNEQSYLLGLGVCYQAMNQADSAEKYFQPALKSDSTNSTALMGMVYVEYARGRYNDALEKLKRIDKLYPQNTDVRYWTALTLNAMGRNAEALNTCIEAVNLAPDFVEARNLVAGLLYQHGDDAQAIQQWTQVLALDRNNSEALLGLAKSNDILGNKTEAWSNLRRWKNLHATAAIDSETAALLKKYDLED
jgi:tetratricopeptide (TPR) repeat protein